MVRRTFWLVCLDCQTRIHQRVREWNLIHRLVDFDSQTRLDWTRGNSTCLRVQIELRTCWLQPGRYPGNSSRQHNLLTWSTILVTSLVPQWRWFFTSVLVSLYFSWNCLASRYFWDLRGVREASFCFLRIFRSYSLEFSVTCSSLPGYLRSHLSWHLHFPPTCWRSCQL